MATINRRDFLHSMAGLAAAGLAQSTVVSARAANAGSKQRARAMRFGLVTYMWGADWNLPTLLSNCERAGALGVELRTGHAHGVEPGLPADKRREVKKRFADSPVTLIGLGSNEDFHDVDPNSLRSSIEQAKAF